MFETLHQYFENKSGLKISEDEKELINSKFRLKKLRKRQYLYQEGDICRHMTFTCKGASRMYSVDDKGQEHIIRFGMEGWWLGDFESYMLGIPSVYHVEMLEDSELLIITREDMEILQSNIPAVKATLTALDQQRAIATQQRVHAAISQTAEERFDSLMRSHPEFFQRFPQTMLASYLGISAETLSRIKRKIANK